MQGPGRGSSLGLRNHLGSCCGYSGLAGREAHSVFYSFFETNKQKFQFDVKLLDYSMKRMYTGRRTFFFFFFARAFLGLSL